MSFPIGSTLCGGNFEITGEIRGTPARGMYTGREVGSGAELLITVGGQQTVSLDELRAKLAWRIDGFAPLRFIGPLDSSLEGQHVGMVEAPPEGAPASTQLGLPMNPAAATALILQVARIAEDAPTAVTGLRPELIFVAGDRITGIAPRCEPFLKTARASSHADPACFDNFYLAPEVLARPFDVHGNEADVFSLAAILGHWTTGHPLFEGVGAPQASAIATNRRRAAVLPHQLADVIEAGLLPMPSERPDLMDWILALERIGW